VGDLDEMEEADPGMDEARKKMSMGQFYPILVLFNLARLSASSPRALLSHRRRHMRRRTKLGGAAAASLGWRAAEGGGVRPG
jgi:hypothetical protein